jgi:type III secretion system FlhB-like substrate exporter
MHQFALEVSQLVHGLNTGAEVAEKIASDAGSRAAQSVVAGGSTELYSVIVKQAQELGVGRSTHQQVVHCVAKVAEALRKPAPTPEQCHKIAAAVTADTALTEVLKTDGTEQEKYAEMQRFGREFFVRLLGDII